MKILIAEDDPVSLKVLQLTLENAGHSVVATTDGDAAWSAFQQDSIRIVISDWMMPGTDGIGLCKRIREAGKADYTYFILLTAINTGRDNLRTAMDAEVDDFLSKPLDREMILAERILDFTTQLRRLKELIPICMYCKRMRDDSDYWQQVENYIHAHTGSNFSHGICPECYTREFGTSSRPHRSSLSQHSEPPETL
jgi:CheY-like chemotaxis protein